MPVLALAGAGCVTQVATPYPLYPTSQAVRPEQTAVLQGRIAQIDAQDVGRYGSLFALLPGCHIVVLKKTSARAA